MKHTIRILFVLVLVIVIDASFVSTTFAAELVTLTGKRLTGTLTQIDPQFVRFQENGASTITKFAIQDLSAIELQKPAPTPPGQIKYDAAELTDGSMLRFSQIRVKGKAVEVTFLPAANNAAVPTLDLPLSNLYWYLRNADEDKNREDWKKLLTTRGKRDLFVIRQPDGLNPLAGTVIDGAATGEAVQFEREDGQRVNLKLVRATGGIIFNQVPRTVIPTTLCKVNDVFGNLWLVTAIDLIEGRVVLKTVSGATVTYASMDGLTKLDFSQGNISYLSELEATIDYPPPEKDGLLGDAYPFVTKVNRDRMIGGDELLIEGKHYNKGLAIPPDTSLTYKLDGTFRELRAVAAIPDGINRDSWSLKLRIEVDGRSVFEEVITRKIKFRDITLNVQDAKLLRIIVERDSLFLGNQLILGDIRLQK